MSKRLTLIEVQKRLDDTGCDIDIIGVYKNTHIKCLCRCRKDNCEWMVRINDVFNGHGCPRCANSERISDSTVDLFLKNRNITRLEHVINSASKHKYRCTIDGNEWYTRYSDLRNCHGCPKCRDLKLRNIFSLSKDEFVEKANIIHNYRYDYSNFIYINQRTKGCIICNYHGSFYQTPGNHTTNKAGCPKCNSSKGEIFIESYLISQGYNYISQATFTECVYKIKLRYDFFIPSKNVLIEFDGIQHFEINEFFHRNGSLDDQIKKDYIKTQYAEKNHYHLIRLPHDASKEEMIASLGNIRFYKDC